MSSGGRVILKGGSIITVGNKALLSFPLKWWTRGLGFSGTTISRPVFKSGPAEVIASASAEGTSGGEPERGYPPLVKGVRGFPPRIFLIYGCLYVCF